MQVLPVIPSVEPVVSHSRSVLFHSDRIAPAVSLWGHLLDGGSGWEHPCHFSDGTEETARWIFVLDVLNHCFWPDAGEPIWTVDYRGEQYSGYWGLAASLKRAVEWGMPITRADYLAEISPDDLESVFSGQGRIPLFEERLFNLREAGAVLRDQWGGDVVKLLISAQNSAVRLVELVVSSFPSFRDQALYHGRTVYLWKRAQIFASDLHNAFSGKGLGNFEDIRRLTAFADYKLPQVLRAFGVISYRPDLADRVDNLVKLEAGSEEEVEIRAMTIWAVEAFRKAFADAGKPVSSAQVDNWLWQLGQLDSFRQKPYHRTRTIYY